MTGSRAFRFGVQAATASSAAEWIAKVKAVEDNGYSMLGVSDHFNPQLAAIPAMTAAAMCTTTLEVGATVLGNDFRHPAVLGKELATIDLLSGGRTFIGLGAGWLRSDYAETGLPFDEAPVRIDRLIETISILKGLFGADPFTFEGRHYRVTGLDGTPKPVQRPRPPIFIGGGAKRILSVAAREADIVGVNIDLRGGGLGDFAVGGSASGPIDQKISWIRDAAGDRFDQLELNVCVFTVAVTDDGEATARTIADQHGVCVDQVLATPNVLIGSAAQIIDTLQRRRDRYSISNIMIPYARVREFAPVVESLGGR